MEASIEELALSGISLSSQDSGLAIAWISSHHVGSKLKAAYMAPHPALGDVDEGLDAELAEHELLTGEEFLGKGVVEHLLYGTASKAHASQVWSRQPVGDAKQELEGNVFDGA